MSPLLLLLILATLQGLTEYLPVSSSAHLVLGKEFLPGGDKLAANASVEVLLHVGTLLAVLLFYRIRIMQLIKGIFGIGSKVSQQRCLAAHLIVATIPAAILGFAMKDHLENLFGSPYPAACALLVTGCILWFSRGLSTQGKSIHDLSWKMALLIGLVQAFAIMPGISRSGSTIVVGLMLGLSGEAAAAFSFLMSIPAIVGAAVLKVPEIDFSQGFDLRSLSIAVGVSFLVGWVALGLLVWITRRGQLHLFAPYCWLLGLAALSTSLF